jgi:RNA polymerase sigma factor (sigma-70 family)
MPGRDVESLARIASAGDLTALNVLLVTVRPEVLRVCSRVLRDREDAEEACQDTLLAVARGLPRFEGRSAFRTWMFRLATNRARSAYRRNRAVAHTDRDEGARRRRGPAAGQRGRDDPGGPARGPEAAAAGTGRGAGVAGRGRAQLRRDRHPAPRCGGDGEVPAPSRPAGSAQAADSLMGPPWWRPHHRQCGTGPQLLPVLRAHHAQQRPLVIAGRAVEHREIRTQRRALSDQHCWGRRAVLAPHVRE